MSLEITATRGLPGNCGGINYYHLLYILIMKTTPVNNGLIDYKKMNPKPFGGCHEIYTVPAM